jgi:hypothetical protein
MARIAVMSRNASLGLILLLLAGCHEPTPSSPDPNDQSILSVETRHSRNETAPQFDNPRLKRNEVAYSPIDGDDNYRTVDGMWVAESSDPSKSLIFREQVRITCTRTSPIPTCHFITVPLGVTRDLISVMDFEEADWPVSTWDKSGLLATNPADDTGIGTLDERCHSHVLSMTFSSGAVSTSDIPTHGVGCEAFKETNSYRLVRGNYYVSTAQ